MIGHHAAEKIFTDKKLFGRILTSAVTNKCHL